MYQFNTACVRAYACVRVCVFADLHFVIPIDSSLYSEQPIDIKRFSVQEMHFELNMIGLDLSRFVL